MVEMEGPQGTGTLESDEELLAQHAAALATNTAATPAHSGSVGDRCAGVCSWGL